MKKNTKFVTYAGFPFGQNGTDLKSDDWSQTVVLEVLRRYFRVDLSEAEISGWVDNGGKKMHLVFYVGERVIQDYSIQSMVTGTVCVHLPSEQAIKSDPFARLADAWAKILGYPQGYPRSLEIDIRQDGLLTLEVAPCF